ncbi:hypothetical protein PEPS_16800 [Persicobacter psychrovividus]|uniref:Uncharacterized protein n=1 Tax=Persicobacter psychrovividus TaxID=387638 RepID=A0ABN6L867_9BACT|nr:hypothetical protein PEPS_16800 [Persicobacter psychrovividus]
MNIDLKSVKFWGSQLPYELIKKWTKYGLALN